MTDGGRLSVVVVARQEAQRLPALLADLARGGRLVREVLVVDGGSRDATATVARLAGARLLREPPCRGGQIAAGVRAASAPWLLLLHGDVRLPLHWWRWVTAAIAATDTSPPASRPARAWCFPLAIDGRDPALRLVEAGVALRSRIWQRPYGDQGLLLPRWLYEACGGMAPLPLMEDLEFVQRLRRQARIDCLPVPLTVNGSRWRRLGVWRTTWINARLRRAWRRGEPAEVLAAIYTNDAQGEYQKAQRRCNGSSSHPWAS